MDIELPNGTVIQDIPEGTTKGQVMAKAIRAGLATPADFGIQMPTQPEKPSMTQELGRQLGLFGRAAYEGITSPATVVLEGLRSGYNLGANLLGSEKRLPSIAQAQGQMLTNAGLPEPQNALERAVQAGTQAMTGTGTVAAIAPRVPALAANLVKQIPASGAAGFVAQPTAEAIKELTVGQLGETGSDLAATVAAMGVGAKVGQKVMQVKLLEKQPHNFTQWKRLNKEQLGLITLWTMLVFILSQKVFLVWLMILRLISIQTNIFHKMNQK